MANTYFEICAYIQKIMLSHIKSPQTFIYYTKTYQKHEITFSKIHLVQQSIFSKKYKFIKISFFCLFSWPAFGGPTILVYTYIYIYIYKTFFINIFSLSLSLSLYIFSLYIHTKIIIIIYI